MVNQSTLIRLQWTAEEERNEIQAELGGKTCLLIAPVLVVHISWQYLYITRYLRVA